jgi:hypothetical protein
MTCNSGLCTSDQKQKWKHPYVSIARGMKSLHGVHSTYDMSSPK